jgi:serine/threonine protein kinase
VIRRGHFTEFDAAKLMRDLISALHELHRHDILHLDIKPENIIFDTDAEDARIKLTDFGLSKVPSLSLPLLPLVPLSLSHWDGRCFITQRRAAQERIPPWRS